MGNDGLMTAILQLHFEAEQYAHEKYVVGIAPGKQAWEQGSVI